MDGDPKVVKECRGRKANPARPPEAREVLSLSLSEKERGERKKKGKLVEKLRAPIIEEKEGLRNCWHPH